MGAPEAGRVGSTEAGRVGSTEACRGEFHRGGLLLMIVLSLACGPFAKVTGTIIQCE